MSEPPAKRARRTDSTAMWEQNANTSSRSRRTKAPEAEEPHGERHDRNRHDAHDTRRDRNKDHKDERNGDHRSRGKEGRVRDRRKDMSRSRSRSRSRERPRTDHHRTRSRSPRQDSRNGDARTRSPPRGPRSDPQRYREPPDRKDGSSKESLQPKSQSRKRGKRDGISTDTDIQMNNSMDEADEEARMMKVMGFGSFRSTKDTKVPGNDKNYGVRKEKKNTYRQYMNRQGGFNRPLSPS